MDLSVESSIPPQACPGCGKRNDLVSGPAKPEPGDISVCLGCGAVLIFRADMSRAQLPLAYVPQDLRPEVELAIFGVRLAKAFRPRTIEH